MPQNDEWHLIKRVSLLALIKDFTVARVIFLVDCNFVAFIVFCCFDKSKLYRIYSISYENLGNIRGIFKVRLSSIFVRDNPSAMYRTKDLQDCIFGLIGFRQNDNPDYPTLAPSLVASASGLYVQDEHPLLCIENIDQALKNYDHFAFPAYVIGTTYGVGIKIRYTNNKVYESLQAANIGNEPSAVNSLFWVEVDLFSQRLDSLLRAAGGKVVASVFEQKKIDGATKSIIESVQIFGGSGALIDKEIKTGRFVGYAIGLSNQRDMTAIIRRLGTQFSQANPNLNIYVYHSSQESPIKIFNLALTKTNSFEWSRLLDTGSDYILRYTSEGHESGGYFYIGYYEDDLVGQAINKEYNFATPPTCGSCSSDYAYYQEWSRFFDIVPFYVSASHLTGILPGSLGGPKLWALNVMQATYTRNYGLNLDLSISCDVTDFLCRERSILANALMKQVSVDILNLLAYSTRNTVISKETQAKAMHELNNKDNATPGAQKKLENALKALSFDMSGLSGSCLPCDNNKGPTWGSI